VTVSKSLNRIALVAVTTIALGLALTAGGGSWHKPADGLPDAGQVTFWFLQLAILAHTVLGVRILGVFVVSGFIAPQAEKTVSRTERDNIVHAAALAGLWAMAALAAAIATLSNVLALSLRETLTPGILGTYLWALPPSRAYLYTALIAVGISIWATLATALNSIAILSALTLAGIISPLLNSHSASLGDHSLALTASVTHGIAMSLWVGALFAMGPYIKSGSQIVIARFSTLATWSVIALAVSGAAAAYTRMDSLTDLWRSGYGELVLIKIVLFVVVMLVAAKVRTRLGLSKSIAKFVRFEIMLMAIAIGVGVALHSTPMSRASKSFASAAEEILGFAFPPAPTFRNMFFGWHPEWTMLLIGLMSASLYVVGIMRLRRNQIPWHPLRTTSFLTGISIMIWTTCAGIAMYAQISFSAHMVQHMMLSMMAPIFLVSGMPVTLALRALPVSLDGMHRSSREWVLATLHSRYAQFITNPLIVLAIFTVGLYGMYFTSLFPTLMASHTGHILMEIHFLLSGTLFAFVVIGSDPAPREIPYWARLLMVLVALSLHAFFALAIMQSSSAIGASWYGQVQPPWLIDPIKDSATGGGIAWAFGEIPTLIMMVMVAVQWSKSDGRLAKRLDRAADRDGDQERLEYNKRLNELNIRDNQ